MIAVMAHAPPSREETLRALRSGNLDVIEDAFDALWYDLPDQHAPEVLKILERVPPEVLDHRPRLTHLALLAERRRSHEQDDERNVSQSFQLYVRAGLRYVHRLRGLSRHPDLLAAGTAAVVGHRHRRDYTSSERIGAWLDARLVQGPPEATLPWTAPRPEARPGWLSVQRGITAMLSGAGDAAVTLFNRAYDEAGDRPPAHYARLCAASNLALLSAYRGHHDLAREHLGSIAQEPPFPDWIAGVHTAGEPLARAQLAIQEGDPTTALAVLDDLPRRSPPRGDLWAFHAFTVASYHAHYGDPLRGLREVDEMRLLHGMVDRDAGAYAGRLVLRAEAKLLLRAGRAARVLQLAHDHDPDVEWLATHHAWAHLTVGENQEALGLASAALHRSQLSPVDALELHVVMAVAHLRAGREDKARTWFQRALRLRATPRHVAPFLAMRPQEREALTRLAGAPSILPGGTVTAGRNAPGVTLAARLSPRERAVLQALSEGCTAQDAAERFSVSVNTVRTQIRTIYRKLGVSRRHEALAAAQELGLITTRSPARSGA